MQFSAKSEDTDSEYFYELTYWVLDRLTYPNVLYPAVEIAGLQQFYFKSYNHSPQVTYFKK
jgi:hypothetical protein